MGSQYFLGHNEKENCIVFKKIIKLLATEICSIFFIMVFH